MKKGVIFLLVIPILIFVGIVTISATDYYVNATSGNDSLAGTSPATAWQTISKVNSSSFNPGDVIYLERGSMWREQLNIPSSGNSTHPITFSAYGSGNRPIISAANEVTNFTNISSTIWQANVSMETTLVLFNNLTTGVNRTNLGDLEAEYEWTWNDSTLYVYSPTDPDSRYSIVETPQRENAIYIYNKSYLNFTNITFRHGLAVDGFGAVVETRYGHNLTFRDCVFERGDSRGIQDSSDTDDVFLNNCTSQYNRETGIGVSGAGWTLINVTSNYNGMTTYGYDGSGLYADGPNVTIINSTFSYNGNSTESDGGHQHGVYLNDGTNGSILTDVVASNNVRGNGFSIRDDVNATRIYAANNKRAGIAVHNWGSSDLRVNIHYSVSTNNTYGFNVFSGGVGDLTLELFNSVIYGNNNTDANFPEEIGLAVDIYNATIRNVVSFGVQSSGLDDSKPISSVTQSNLSMDYNLIYHETTHPLVYYNSSTRTWVYWQGIGFDLNSVNTTPIFTSPKEANFILNYTSPAIDSGIDVGLTTDYLENPIYGTPDIGSYEYQPPYNITLDDVEYNGTIRIYGDGKYRYKNRSSGFNLGNKTFIMVPETGYFNHTSSQIRNSSYDIDLQNWTTEYVKFNVTNLSMSEDVNFTICSLTASKDYNLSIDSVENDTYTTSPTGCIAFQYIGNWSEHQFELQEIASSGSEGSSSSSSGGGGGSISSTTSQEDANSESSEAEVSSESEESEIDGENVQGVTGGSLFKPIALIVIFVVVIGIVIIIIRNRNQNIENNSLIKR